MPTSKSKKQPVCKYCGNKLAKRKDGKGSGYAHKKREHWLDRPHPAAPVWEEESLPAEAL